MRKCKDEKGFTLLELTVVVAIIGILLAIAVAMYKNAISSANKVTCLANQRTIESARTYNMNKNGSYGSSIDDLEEVFDLIGFLGFASEEDLKCPSGGSYSYNADSPEVNCSIARHN